jgi:hypothetical protein
MLWRRIVVSVVMFGVLAACGADTPAASGDGEPGTSKSSEGKGGGWLSWVPFGPKDPKSPTPGWPAYNAFANGKCSELRTYLKSSDAGEFGRSDFATAMLAVCRAAVDGQTKQWDVAAKHAGADPSLLGHDCLAPLIKSMIDRALAWHKTHPGEKPKVTFKRAKGGMTACGKKDGQSEEPTTEPTDSTEEPTTKPSDPAGEPSSEPTEETSPEETTESTG